MVGTTYSCLPESAGGSYANKSFSNGSTGSIGSIG